MIRRLGIAGALFLLPMVGCVERKAPPDPIDVTGYTRGILSAEPSDAPRAIVDGLSLLLDPAWQHVVAVRLSIVSGTAIVVVRDQDGGELCRRRVSLHGDNLILMPIPRLESGRATLQILQAARVGPTAFEILGLSIHAVHLDEASALSERLARSFEAETGRRGDPVQGNLVPNPNFAADDEVRGTPADWLAYVDTKFDERTHELHVFGAPFAERPYLETGPISVPEAGRYRGYVKITVEQGGVLLRVVDYDGLKTLFTSKELGNADGRVTLDLEFDVPDDVAGIRLRFEPPVREAAARFSLEDVELERLPSPAAPSVD